MRVYYHTGLYSNQRINNQGILEGPKTLCGIDIVAYNSMTREKLSTRARDGYPLSWDLPRHWYNSFSNIKCPRCLNHPDLSLYLLADEGETL